jgi:hypothetical protein
MLGTAAKRLPTYRSERPSYTVVTTSTQRSPINKETNSERVIPIEKTTSQYRV